MRNRKLISLAVSVLFALVWLNSAWANDMKQRVIVRYAPGHGAALKANAVQAGGHIIHEFNQLNAFAVSLPDVAIKGFLHNPNVLSVQEDAKRYMSADTVPYGVDLVQARGVWDTDANLQIDDLAPDGSGIKVCIIDSGLAVTHEDFAGVDIIGGYPVGWDTDACGHGTHVAGTVAAALNGIGVVGVTPGMASLYIVKVFGNDCSWSYASDLVDAGYKCQAAGANIISMSLGGPSFIEAEDLGFQQLAEAGILSVAAAGNDGNTDHSYPASYDSVMSVAAVDDTKTVADFSQQNAQVEISAPGVAVLSTVPWVGVGRVSVNGQDYECNAVKGAKNGTGAGILVDGGNCANKGSWRKKVVMCTRDHETYFSTMLANAASGGAKAAIIINDLDQALSVSVDRARIPAVSLKWSLGEALLGLTGSSATVLINVEPGSGYEAWDGTSMATPHVSAVAALVWSSDLDKSGCAIRHALTLTAEDLGGAGRDDAYGFGLVQAADALNLLPSLENLAPAASFTKSCSGNACDFDGSASTDCDGSIASYEWDFGNGQTAAGSTASHTYGADGTYTVTLTVVDDLGASSSTTKEVTIGGSASMHVSAIDMWYTKRGKTYNIYTTVTVLDDAGDPVANAGVSLSMTLPGGTAAGGPFYTASDGTVTLVLERQKRTGVYTSTVTDIIHETLTYDPASNEETSDSLSVP